VTTSRVSMVASYIPARKESASISVKSGICPIID
jgi:hypothetical protein